MDNKFSSTLPKPKIFKINNLQCAMINFPCSQVVSAGFFVKIGSAYEPMKYRGISHYLEHMLFKKNKYSNQMTNKLDELGISYNAATSREHTYYECHGNITQIKEIIFLLFMIFTQAIFDKKDVDKEREVIFEEMKGDKMSNKKQLFESTINQIFSNRNQNYSLPIIGTIESLNNIDSNTLKEYFDSYYHYDNAVLVIVGNMKYTVIEKYIEGLVKKYPRTGIKSDNISMIDIVTKPQMYIKSLKDPSQTTMMVNFFIKDLTELQKTQLFLLNHILTGNFMSIFFNELRVKRGLCYGVDSDNMLIKTNDRYSGVFFVKIDADPSKIKECLKIILDFIMAKKINKKSFNNSKKSLNNIVSFSFQTSKDYLYYYGNMLLNKDTILPSEIIDKLKNTSLKDINNLLNIIKNGNLYVNMIGAYN